jgi:DNA mismatch endonuclease (patch repair protein)
MPGRPDIVLPRYHTVVFMHGCFWHRHGGCKQSYKPKSRVAFWTQKFDATVARDRRVARILRASGWRVVIVWECQLHNAAAVARRFSRLRDADSKRGARRAKP